MGSIYAGSFTLQVQQHRAAAQATRTCVQKSSASLPKPQRQLKGYAPVRNALENCKNIGHVLPAAPGNGPASHCPALPVEPLTLPCPALAPP